jgi:hypothetical protein
VRKKLIFVIILTIILSAIYLFFANLNNPSGPLSQEEKEASLTKLLGRPLQQGPAQKKDVKFNGKYMNFTYPGSSVIYTYRQPGFNNDKTTLEYFSFDMKDTRLIFNYSVIQTINLKNVSDYPSVRVRQSQGEYQYSDFTLDGKKGILFIRKDSQAEESLFILEGDRLYTILVAGSNFLNVDELFQKIIKSSKFL